MQELPIGVDNFAVLRQKDRLYVDKTQRLAEVADRYDWVFLARPRRFGKTLAVSTLEAMFSGRTELFQGLAAEGWVAKQSEKPKPVIRLNMAFLPSLGTVQDLNDALVSLLQERAKAHGVPVPREKHASMMLNSVMQSIYNKSGHIVVLIDEYDKPILDNIDDIEKANEIRRLFGLFFSALKACSEYISFVFITGISKFAKFGLFSPMNNLNDISNDKRYGDILGCSQEELEKNYDHWIKKTAKSMNISCELLLEKVRKYYDGFSFNGEIKVYNPFSLNSFFDKERFDNYWYNAGQSSFFIKWIKRHGIKDPEEYRHLIVPIDFADLDEIERARSESFLYQAGYLTIEKLDEQQITLDYPNYEVINAVSKLYAQYIMKTSPVATSTATA